jgi:VWFA-related protein
MGAIMGSRSRRRLLALPLLAVAAAAQTLSPQEARLTATPYIPVPAVTIKAETRLVEVEVVVRDSRGHPVGGLAKPDFEVRDEGKRREISAFSVQTFLPASAAGAGPPAAGSTASTPAPALQPRWLAMVFDDLSMPPDNLFNAKAAARRFLKGGLAANDRVSVLTISRGQVLPFTTDAARIAEAIDKVYLQERKLRAEGCPLITEYDAYLIANHLDPTDLVVKAREYTNCNPGVCPSGGGGRRGAATAVPCQQAADQVQMLASGVWEQVRMQSNNTFRTLENIVDFMARMPGTRVILLASSGFISGTLESAEEQVIDKALRANVVIDSLDAKGLYTTELELGQGSDFQSVIHQQQMGSRPKGALNDALGSLADATGGLFFHDNNDLDLGFKELGMQPQVSYLLGFPPEVLDSKYHRLKVSLTSARHDTIQARKGYLAAPEKAPATDGSKPAVDRRMDKEVFTSSRLEETPVTVTLTPRKSPEGRSMARLSFHIDVGKVQFQDRDGTHAQTFHMIAALFDAQGGYVTGLEGLLEFALQEASYRRMSSGGFTADLNLDVPAGSYRLRTVVLEGGEAGRYTTATQ